MVGSYVLMGSTINDLGRGGGRGKIGIEFSFPQKCTGLQKGKFIVF